MCCVTACVAPPGGVGKSTLALKFAAGQAERGGERLWLAGPHTMQCCTRHFGAVRPVWSAFSTQCTVNL